jgi:hypothetical protein
MVRQHSVLRANLDIMKARPPKDLRSSLRAGQP